MKTWTFWALSIALAVLAARTGVAATTLCAANEQVIFSCQIGASKIASVCGSPNLGDEGAYLQYRMGMPKRLELVFPPKKRASQDRFSWNHTFRPRYGMADWLEFSTSKYRYSVYEIENGDGQGGPPEFLAGVDVFARGSEKILRRLVCNGRAVNSFDVLRNSAVVQQ